MISLLLQLLSISIAGYVLLVGLVLLIGGLSIGRYLLQATVYGVDKKGNILK